MAQCNDVGERQLIRRISEILGGIVNDDCAVVDAGDRFMVATTDMLHRKSDFPDIMTPWQIGWMTVAVNLSDVAAMGAEPSGHTVTSAWDKPMRITETAKIIAMTSIFLV